MTDDVETTETGRSTDNPSAVSTPDDAPPPRETEPVDVVVGDKVLTFLADEVIAEREIENVGEAPTGEVPKATRKSKADTETTEAGEGGD